MHKANEHLPEASTSQEIWWGPLGTSGLELPIWAQWSQSLNALCEGVLMLSLLTCQMELPFLGSPRVEKGTRGNASEESVDCSGVLWEATFQQKVWRPFLGAEQLWENQMLVRDQLPKIFWGTRQKCTHSLRAVELADGKSLRDNAIK